MIVTAFVLVAIVAAGAFLIHSAMTHPSAGGRILMATSATALAVLVLALTAFVPLGYEVTDEAVVIRRSIRPLRILLSQVAEVRRVELTGVVRVFGVGGFFGYWGRFTSTQLGAFRAYFTQRGNLLCLFLKDGDRVVLSPDDPDGMIAEIRGRTLL